MKVIITLTRYLGYVEWAAANGIVKGTSDVLCPDKAISRQEMATIMASYAKAIGFTLPKAHAEVAFADNANIGAWAKDSVKAMQMAGVLMGKDENKSIRRVQQHVPRYRRCSTDLLSLLSAPIPQRAGC